MHALLLAACLSLPPRFAQAADALLQKRTFAHSSLGLAIYDLDARRTLFERNGNRYFLAASTAAGSSRSIALVSHGSPDDPGQDVSVEGTMPAASAPVLYAYAVPSPRRFAEAALIGVLRAAGMTVQNGDALAPLSAYARKYESANVIAAHTSPPLSEDVKVTLKVSDNLHADTMPYIWGGGNLAQAFAVERRFLQSAHLGSSGVVQNDGLGESAYIEPSFTVRYLVFLRTQPFFSALYSGLPVLGVDGTLYNVETRSPAAGNVRAKTGTWVTGDLLAQLAALAYTDL